jgi:hypothetical protein
MQIKGRLISITNQRSGPKKDGSGNWKSCELVVEQDNKYKDKVLLTAWGQAVDDVKGKENNEVEVEFSISAREYNSKWYNDLTIRSLKFPALYSDERQVDMNQEANEVPEPGKEEEPDLPF